MESQFPEFKNIVQEYREGLLLFDLMEQEVWQKSKTDTIGLKEYYNKNNASYFWKKRVQAIVVTSDNKTDAKYTREMLKNGATIKEIKTKKQNILVSEGLYELKDKELPKKIKLKLGVSKVYKHNSQYVVVNVLEEVLPKLKAFDEVKGRVINDYQVQLEKDWLLSLRTKYKVEVNHVLLENVKKTL